MARRLFAVSVVLSAIALFSLPLAATTTTGTATTIASGTPAGEGTGAGEETGTTASMESGTTAVTDTTGEGATEPTEPAVMIQPAVTVDTTPEAEASADWTYRFFIPTLLVLAALVVIFTVIQYFTRVVRNRYRIVR